MFPLLYLVVLSAGAAVQEQEAIPEPEFLKTQDARRKTVKAFGDKPRRAGRNGLDWLLAHQEEDGSWDCDGFEKHDDSEEDPSGDPGESGHDVGVTGLAVLALLAGGDMREGRADRAAALRALAWLVAQQDERNGRIPEDVYEPWLLSGHGVHVYNHAIATLALCEALVVLENRQYASAAQLATLYIERGRNPEAGWRYENPPEDGKSDTSVSAWMLTALAAADDAGLTVEKSEWPIVLAWFDSITEEDSGRVAYDFPGSFSSRIVDSDHDSSIGEPLTAAALFCRYAVDAAPRKRAAITKSLALFAARPPVWNAKEHTTDIYYLYHATLALHQAGGREWRDWNRALKEVLLPAQRTDGTARGSWDPIGPWGFAGGRVYSTALCVLTLATEARHQRR